MAQLDKLTATVNVTNGVMDSAVVLLEGLSAYIKANVNDPVAMEALAADLQAHSDALANAIVANPIPASEVPVEPAQ